MGKWSHIQDKYPVWRDKNEKHAVKVDAAIVRMQNLQMDHEDLCEIKRTLKTEKDRLEDALSVTQVEIDAIDRLVAEKLQELGFQRFTLENGDTFFLQPEPYSSVSDRTAVYDWFQSNGLAHLLAPPWQTLNAMNKERLENGETLIPGTDVFIKTKVGMRKA